MKDKYVSRYTHTNNYPENYNFNNSYNVYIIYLIKYRKM